MYDVKSARICSGTLIGQHSSYNRPGETCLVAKRDHCFPSPRVTVIPYIPGILQMEAIPGISYRTALWKPMNAKYFRMAEGGLIRGMKNDNYGWFDWHLVKQKHHHHHLVKKN